MKLALAYIRWRLHGRAQLRMEVRENGVLMLITLDCKSWGRLMERRKYYLSLGYK